MHRIQKGTENVKILCPFFVLLTCETLNLKNDYRAQFFTSVRNSFGNHRPLK